MKGHFIAERAAHADGGQDNGRAWIRSRWAAGHYWGN